MAKSLKEREIQLPALYTVTWCQEREAWVGSCPELPSPPRLSELTKSAGAGKKPQERRNA